MRYVAIDIETSGLDPERHQVLEIAAVVETDWSTPADDLPTFRALVNTGDVRGDPVALTMNAELVRELAAAPRTSLDGCLIDLSGFLDEFFPARGEKGRGITIAGKNFGAFDYTFLRRSDAWRLIRHTHRFLDPAALWWDHATDVRLPDLGECCRRAGVPVRPAHRAVHDCRSVIELIRAALDGRRGRAQA